MDHIVTVGWVDDVGDGDGDVTTAALRCPFRAGSSLCVAHDVVGGAVGSAAGAVAAAWWPERALRGGSAASSRALRTP